ncbi:cytochrome P450 [Phlyctema vagabunda]|uniref:Cytochrome P450 n=1 Tax=Phlyctema vagabunda TaxID=108571 RepID=A0ABR4PI28_9HELO
MVLPNLSTAFGVLARAGSTIIILYLLKFITQAIYNVYFHPLSKYPGPKLYAASNLPNALMATNGTIPYKLKALHEKYGHVVRTAPNELVYSDAAAQKDIYMRRPQMPKSTLYYNSNSDTQGILSVKSDEDHSRYRRLLSHAFSEKALRGQEPLIKKYIDLLISRLRSKAEIGEPQDIVAWYNYVSFDIIGDLTLGSSFDCLESSDLHPWVSYLFRSFKAAAFLTAARRLAPLDKILLSLIPKKTMHGRINHRLYTKEKVEARIKSNTDRQDFMTNILKHNDSETGMTINEIIPTFGTLLIGGSETTATLLSVVTFQLLKHPEIMAKLVAEIRTTFKNEDEIDMVSVNQLRYHLAVLDEGLRIHPAVPLGSPRTVPEGGETISGQWVPGGVSLFSSLFLVIHEHLIIRGRPQSL